MDKGLPGGTVALLFTDIESSSRMWDEHRSAMAQALVRHHEIVTGAIDAHDGRIVKDKGDGFFAVFASPLAAVAATLDAQRGLAAADWPTEIGTVKVRMAVHTGTIDPDGDDYHGPVVNRVARLEGIAHGGQVLVSEATRALVADALPDGASLRDLGSHTLRGMARPETVYQLVIDGLAGEFPPLRSEAAGGIPLPSYPTSFVGRDKDVSAIADLLDGDGVRLVTLLGPGGIGKTRLAVEAASHAPTAYFADLAPLSDPDHVPFVIAEAVGAHPEGSASPVSVAAAVIAEPTLLVIDNFEHVTSAATAVAELLAATDQIRVLATSRTPLNVRGERIVPLEPLSSADGDGSMPPALALFYERAAGHGVTLETSGPDRDAALAITHRLDGLPLAIELVAARTRTLGLPDLAALLDESLDVLGSGSVDSPDRQRTIRSTIEWSLGSLTAEQQGLFEVASVFPEGATLDQLAAVSGRSKVAVLDDVTALVDNSLITVVTGLPGGTRYRQLVLMRDYGRERLAAAGRLDDVMGALVDHYVATAPATGIALGTTGRAEPEVAADHQNLLAAMNWSLENGRVEDMVGVTGEIWPYWFNGDLMQHAAVWVARADAIHSSPKVDWLAGLMALQAGDAPTALERFGAAARAFAEAGDEEWTARSEMFQAFFTEDSDDAMAMASRAADVFGKRPPSVDLFMAKQLISSQHLRAGDFARTIEIRRELVDWATTTADYPTMIAWGHWNLAIALLMAGQVEDAHRHTLETLGLMAGMGYQEGIASAADIAGAVRIRNGDPAGGVRLIGGANTIWANIGAYRWPEATVIVDEVLATATDSLGESEVERLLAEGAALSLHQVIDLAQTVD